MVIRTKTEYEKAIYDLLYLKGIIIGQNINDKDVVGEIVRRTVNIYDILKECIQNSLEDDINSILDEIENDVNDDTDLYRMYEAVEIIRKLLKRR